MEIAKEFAIEMEVRDYECDIFGVVNNASYLNYLEHSRHKFLSASGLDLDHVYNTQKIAPVVVKAEVEYKFPLTPRDRFVSKLHFERKGTFKVLFHQTIWKLPEEKLCIKATITAACIQNGRPVPSEVIFAKIS